MLAKRLGETPAIRYRSDRFYRINSDWYFSTREGFEMGPYESRALAEQALTDLFDSNRWARESGTKASTPE